MSLEYFFIDNKWLNETLTYHFLLYYINQLQKNFREKYKEKFEEISN